MSSSPFGNKQYPQEYDPQAVKILETMSFPLGKLQLFGSMTIPSQIYAGDYDGVDYVSFSSLEKATKEFQLRVKETSQLKDCFLADMKIGEISDWNIWGNTSIRFTDGKFRLVNYDKSRVLQKINQLWTQKIIPESQYQLIKEEVNSWGENPEPDKYIQFVKDHRPHILRWTLREVSNGVKQITPEISISLSSALSSRGVVKVDAIGLVGGQSRFTDFSVIYEIQVKKKIITAEVIGTDMEEELRQSLFENVILGNYYKALKRLFSLGRFYRDTDLVMKLSDYFNGAVGIVYQVKSDIGTLLYLEENYESLPREKIQYELKMFRVRLTAYNETYKNQRLNQMVNDLLESKSKPKTIRYYKEMEDTLSKIINGSGKLFMKKVYPKIVVD